jgi:hypothetical protein
MEPEAKRKLLKDIHRGHSEIFLAGDIGLIAAVAEQVQQVFGLAWRTGGPSIKHQVNWQAVRMIGRGFGGVQSGQAVLLLLGRFAGAGLHGSPRC